MLAAVARAFEPGHKFDFVPILEGVQGKRKSTFIRVLAVDWFGELKGDFSDDKIMVEQMMGKWMLEIPELLVHKHRLTITRARGGRDRRPLPGAATLVVGSPMILGF